MNYRDYITIEPNKRSGKPCVRGLRITVEDQTMKIWDLCADARNQFSLRRTENVKN